MNYSPKNDTLRTGICLRAVPRPEGYGQYKEGAPLVLHGTVSRKKADDTHVHNNERARQQRLQGK